MQAIVRREAEAIGAEIGTDVLGTTIATVKGTVAIAPWRSSRTPTRSGCRSVTRASDGLLTVAQLANWSAARRARASACGSLTADGEVRGVVVAPREGEPSRGRRCASTSAPPTVSEALELVRPGDPVVLDGPPEALPNGRVLSRRARRPGRHLRRPRGAATSRRRPARVGRRARRDRAGGEQPRRRARRPRSGSRPTSRS